VGREHGVDLSQVHGTGPGGRIIKADVLDFVGTLLPYLYLWVFMFFVNLIITKY
jgi:e3 binding domain